MNSLDLVLFVHILGWVFWLGTDLGVLVGAKITEDGKLSVETRLTVLKLAMILDMAPRLMVPLVFMTGLYLSSAIWGAIPIPLFAGLGFGVVWLGVVLLGIFAPQQSRMSEIAEKLGLVIQAIVVVVMGGVAVNSLLGSATMPAWLAAKWLTYAWIAIFAIGIEVTFKPAIADYAKLQMEGASDALNADLKTHLKPVYLCVYGVYLGTFVAALLGVTKPF